MAWKPDGTYGAGPGASADVLGMEVALDMECKNLLTAGVSYDMEKCFDLLPWTYVLKCLELRGASPHLLRPLRSMYHGIRRVFKLKGSCSPWWSSSNGILQGDPMSMVGLVAVFGVILETASAEALPARLRAYADDLSATTTADTPEELGNNLRRVHAIVSAFAEADGGKISERKSFTFGELAVKGILGGGFAHLSSFRLVGGSIVVQDELKHATALNDTRLNDWRATADRARHAPVAWRQKALALLSKQ
eukprot:6492569-Amphidinium_carterae.3